jgi:hypothetical protein
MPKLKIADIEGYDRADLERLPREELEDLLRRLLELTRHQANQLGANRVGANRVANANMLSLASHAASPMVVKALCSSSRSAR